MELVHADDRAAVDAQFAKVLERGGDYEVEFRIRSPEGRQRWLLSRGRVMHDPAGPGSRVVGVSVDITEQKTMEQALRDGDARRNEFLAMLGHELRNPLAPITNAVRLLEKMGADADSRTAAVQIIRRQAQHMARLVDDLLEVSRITQGRIELRMENLLVATSVYSAIEAARPLARQKQHHIDVSVPPDLDLVADPARLTQILSNLLVNAVKYTPPGGRIGVEASAAADGCVEIRVRDNGNGISPELLPRVFELFTQDRRTLERSEGGLGLGLALVKRLVELHGGSVEAQSAGPGRGATFTVRLPQHGRREELRPTETHPRSVHVSPLAVLIVDDNRDAAETLAALLRLDGHRVAVAFDGPEALETAAHEGPDFVLLDIGLPQMNGLEVARRLRRMPQLAATRVIGMTGYAQESDRAAAKEAGFDAHLAKPAELADVYRVMEELMNA
jgi:two-component system CheB/CheR fusion protein